jgi:hypothetical protein
MRKVTSKIRSAALLLMTLTGVVYASNANATGNSGGSRIANLSEIATLNLRFIANSQVKKADGVYVPGEWRTQVYSSPVAVVLGIGDLLKGEEEPSAFTTSTMVNQLMSLYKDHPEFKQIPPMIARALPSVERFREGVLYNFYPPKIWRGVRVHQAATMTLSPIWIGDSNVPEDADTSSVTYTAKFFSAQLAGKKFAIPPAVLKSFKTYRDLKREPHYYNADMRMYNTGAYLTWQMNENDPRMPRFWFAQPEEGARIPFNDNDVDCVVNINVLKMLALTGNSRLPGRDKACGLLGYVVNSEGYAKCGIYYPNTYNFHYSASLMDASGETCLRPYADQMVSFILKNRGADGGWYNQDNYHVDDRVHATAFAMLGLAQFGQASDARVRNALASGSKFLMSRLKRSQAGNLYWEGEVFFTATAIARSLIDWKNDSFTTAVSLSALLKADKVLAGQP